MSIIDRIAAIQAREDLDEDGKRKRRYAEKTSTLIGVIEPLIGHSIRHAKFSFCINDARMTEQHALYLDVTLNGWNTHQVTIVNPPVLPRERTGNETRDLVEAVCEMLEGIV